MKVASFCVPVTGTACTTGTCRVDEFPFVTTGECAGVWGYLCGCAVVHGRGVGNEGRREGRGGGEVDVRVYFNRRTRRERKGLALLVIVEIG